MSLPEIKVEEEFIDESTTDPATNKNDADAPPDGWSGRRQHSPSQPAGDGPEPFGRTSRAIADGLANIAAGRSRGEHPALDAILGRTIPKRYAEDPAGYAESVCTPECPNRRRDQDYDQGANATASPLYLVGNDVKPSTRERLYHVERELERHEREFSDFRQSNATAASKQEVQFVDSRVDHVHTRIDRDIAPDLKSLLKRRFLKDTLVVTSLVISIIGNIIALYKIFVNP